MIKSMLKELVLAVFWGPDDIPHVLSGGVGKEPGKYDDDEENT